MWNDQKRAQELGREKKSLDGTVGILAGIGSGLKDAKELFEMARAESDDATLSSISTDLQKLENDVGALEFRRMFSNPLDPNSCFMDIQAGAGGTEAQDWASMLERMYIKYCDKKGFKVEELERSDGEVVALALCLPDVNEVLRDVRSGRLLPFGWVRLLRGLPKATRARIFILGVRPEQQNRALGVLLYEELIDRLMAKGIQGAEASWILATNKAMNTAIEGVGATRYKTWRLYRREL